MMRLETRYHAFGPKAAVWICGLCTVPSAPSSY
jgi:hypothetical protein